MFEQQYLFLTSIRRVNEENILLLSEKIYMPRKSKSYKSLIAVSAS